MTRRERIIHTAEQILAALVVAEGQLPIGDKSTRKELVDEAIALAEAFTDTLREKQLA